MDRDQRIRDPIYDLVKFSADRAEDKLLWSLVQSPELQRLRRIRQLGFSEIVYPGATNTRFAHALGALQLARRMLGVLNKNNAFADVPDADNWKVATLVAALIHDVGHGPFSHVFEEVSEELGVTTHHEQWTKEIINSGTFAPKLDDYDGTLKEKILSFFEEEPGNNIFSSIISSQLDVDRLDFLARDRHATGVKFGLVDLEWILDNLTINQLRVDPESPAQHYCFVVKPKGLSAIENYLLAYAEMYLRVYFHKTTRAAQLMLLDILKYTFLEPKYANQIPDDDPVKKYFSSAPNPNLYDYLALDDFCIWNLVHLVARKNLGKLSSLAERLLARDLYKCFEPPKRPKEKISPNKMTNFVEGLNKGNIRFRRDKIPAKRYKEFDAEGISYLKNIFVHSEFDNEPMSIGSLSPAVEQLPDQPPVRFYFTNADDRDEARRIWDAL